jgi:hypothetical protein
MIRAIISLLAALLTAVQVYLLSRGEEAICLNDGCAVVDSLTKVSPLWFNLAGLCFFLTLFWLFIQGRRQREHLMKLARLLLLAALAAEAVLVFFQYSVARVFCSYCLIIFAVVVLLNLCCGFKQILRGAVIFSAVFITCLSLQFTTPPSGKPADLDAGSMAVLRKASGGETLYLFFSSSCPHCENVIRSLDDGFACNLRFNPLERIDNFTVRNAERLKTYDPSVNRAFLKGVSIQEVPLLFINDGEEMRLLKGEKLIVEYLRKTCVPPSGEISGVSQDPSLVKPFIPGLSGGGQDGCSVVSDCPPGQSTPPPIQ